MPNTDREHLEAIVAAGDNIVQTGGDGQPMISYSDLTAAVEAAKHHIASTPDTGALCVAGELSVSGDVISVDGEPLSISIYNELPSTFREDEEYHADFGRVTVSIATTPTPSPPIPDSTEKVNALAAHSLRIIEQLDLLHHDDTTVQAAAKRITALADELAELRIRPTATPDTGGVEGPWVDRAKEVRNDVQDFWPPWFEVKDMGDEWAVTFALPVYTPTRDKIKRAIADFDTIDGAEGLANELNTFVQCAIDEALIAHKAGASGSGEVIRKAAKKYALLLARKVATKPTPYWIERHEELVAALENPASGSDGLKKAAGELLLACAEVDRPDQSTQQIDRWVEARKALAAELSDGGMGDE